MYIELIKKRVEPSDEYYFKVIPNDTKDISERYEISMDDAEMFYDKYADSLGECCEVMIGDGDVECFDKEKCKKIVKWAEEIINDESDPKQLQIIKTLINYSKQAIELDTWIIIEV